jgi:hypothetical protein
MNQDFFCKIDLAVQIKLLKIKNFRRMMNDVFPDHIISIIIFNQPYPSINMSEDVRILKGWEKEN